jgi:hypothetical protein
MLPASALSVPLYCDKIVNPKVLLSDRRLQGPQADLPILMSTLISAS